ncbi:5'-methylthioadenosine/S-adenosylhomocysteine nucleosidase [Spirochaetia bacterium]|nr:5'-methylthioadenosine/S-adenosylhomocysteine nucleosidase [Spirochaetia bacterium]
MIGIIGAMEEEVTILRSLMKDVKTEKIGSFDFICGKLENKEIVLLRCGIGKVNAAVGCALLINRLKPEFIINTGCAGGINLPDSKVKLNFGDVVLSKTLVQHDFDITAFGHALGQIPGMPPLFTADKALIEKAGKAIDDLKKEKLLPENLNHVEGLIGSGDVFMCEPERIKKVAGIFSDMRAVEMEGAAIAQVCTLFNVPFIVIRALSDLAGEESPVKFDEYLPVAAKNSSEIVKRIIKNS